MEQTLWRSPIPACVCQIEVKGVCEDYVVYTVHCTLYRPIGGSPGGIFSSMCDIFAKVLFKLLFKKGQYSMEWANTNPFLFEIRPNVNVPSYCNGLHLSRIL